MATSSVAKARAAALALPEAVEQETWGHPTFRVRAKMFAILDESDSTISVKATLEEQQALIEAQPDAYTASPYVGRYGWVTITLNAAAAAEVAELIVEAWRMTAPKRLVKAFDEGVSG